MVHSILGSHIIRCYKCIARTTQSLYINRARIASPINIYNRLHILQETNPNLLIHSPPRHQRRKLPLKLLLRQISKLVNILIIFPLDIPIKPINLLQIPLKNQLPIPLLLLPKIPIIFPTKTMEILIFLLNLLNGFQLELFTITFSGNYFGELLLDLLGEFLEIIRRSVCVRWGWVWILLDEGAMDWQWGYQ